MVKRWLLLLLVLLAWPAYANVAQDDGTVQVGDPDSLGSTAPVVTTSKSPGQLPLGTPAEGDGKPGSSTGSGSQASTGGAKDPQMGTGKPGSTGNPAGLSSEDLARHLDDPAPMENPYPLIAVGILLLLLALFGGLYFYRNRDREEPLE